MNTNGLTLPPRPDPVDPLRACVHDLRNLFAIVASAKSLLERSIDTCKRQLVLDALDRVASEGRAVTDALLAGPDRSDRFSEAATELRGLVPLIKASEHSALRINVRLHGRAAWIEMAAADYRAVVIELITNAARAGARTIHVRAAERSGRYWLLIADDGKGFVPHVPRPADDQKPGLHGTGLQRLASAARAAHGSIRIKSKIRRGSVVGLVLPILGVSVPAGGQPASAAPRARREKANG